MKSNKKPDSRSTSSDTQTPTEDNEPKLHMEYHGAHAKGKRTSVGFVVLKGSSINPNLTRIYPENAIKARRKYADKINENNILTADVLLTSPSAAAGFAGGSSLSGNIQWKDDSGWTLGQIESE